MLRIYDSMSRSKRSLSPCVPGKVGIYVCGMTVYDFCHIGHARVLVVFDMVVRYLRSLGLDVTYVRNITDIDDKIINRAAQHGEPFEALTERFIAAMHEDCAALFLQPPDLEPRATGHITDIVDMVQRLIERGYAYVGSSGDVFFSVRKFADYGKLSGETLDELWTGARVDADESKRDPLDFVLWKRAKPDEPYWPSPWGDGRPGWHIECSAMSTRCLGNHFDIHAGGMDLQFPHHENEIAQSVAATGDAFARLWMHNGYVQVDREKMSKSLDNFFTIREILTQDNFPARMGEIIRYMVLSSHYRSPLNFSQQALDNAKAALTRLYLVLDKVTEITEETPTRQPVSAGDAGDWQAYSQRFHEAMNDDFNSPEAIAVLFDLTREINRQLDANREAVAATLADGLVALAGILGLINLNPADFLGKAGGVRSADHDWLDMSDVAVQRLVDERNAARDNRDWQTADRIRKRLTAKGVILEDKPNGTTQWRIE